MWKFTERLLGIRRPNGKGTLIHYFFRSDVRDSQNALRIALICCTLWEIWKWRNKVFFDGTVASIQGTMHRWYRDLLPLIDAKFPAIRHPCPLFPPEDLTNGCLVTTALIKRQNCMFGAAIFMPQGNCKCSIFCSQVPVGEGLGELIYFLSKVIAMGRLHGFQVAKISSSNAFISWLNNSENGVPWNELCRVRSFRHKFQGISFAKSCPANNNGALAIAEASAQQLSPVLQVPWVRLALAAERRRLPLSCRPDHCSHDDVFVALSSQGRDDLLMGRRPPRLPD